MLVKGVSILYSFFLRPGFVLLGFTSKVFNETVLTYQDQFKELSKYCTLFPSLGFS